jgi:IS5 family transposase
MTFTDMEYGGRKRCGKRERFLDSMEGIIPWAEFIKIIELFYPKSGRPGRQPRGVEMMLRMYFLQVWFNLADEALEENIYDSYAMRKFMKLDYFKEGVPDATTLLKFRHLLEKHDLQKKLFDTLNGILEKTGKMMHGGTVIDATIIEAPSSTAQKAVIPRDEKREHVAFRAEGAHRGGCGNGHSVEVTGANAHDLDAAEKLIRKDDDFVNADAGYTGIEKRDEIQKDEHLAEIDYRINKKKGEDRKRDDKVYKEPMNHLNYIGQPNWDNHVEYMKSKVRRVCGGKVEIRVPEGGIPGTDLARLYMLFCSANLDIDACVKPGNV